MKHFIILLSVVLFFIPGIVNANQSDFEGKNSDLEIARENMIKGITYFLAGGTGFNYHLFYPKSTPAPNDFKNEINNFVQLQFKTDFPTHKILDALEEGGAGMLFELFLAKKGNVFAGHIRMSVNALKAIDAYDDDSMFITDGDIDSVKKCTKDVIATMMEKFATHFYKIRKN
jgi:hypothetical protein